MFVVSCLDAASHLWGRMGNGRASGARVVSVWTRGGGVARMKVGVGMVWVLEVWL